MVVYVCHIIPSCWDNRCKFTIVKVKVYVVVYRITITEVFQ